MGPHDHKTLGSYTARLVRNDDDRRSEARDGAASSGSAILRFQLTNGFEVRSGGSWRSSFPRRRYRMVTAMKLTNDSA
jgi:hypothetical protein